ncbi:MAG: hypothetical protein JXQ80_09105 [Bacteroidales bacterium]|nr:hypothetical protein [Bacteroidales bacterium]
METGNQFSPDIKALKIIHAAMAIGQILFAALMTFLVMAGLLPAIDGSLANILLIVSVFLIISGTIASQLLFQSRLNLARKETTLTGKLAVYRSALIIRYALIEAPSLFTIIAALLTGNPLFLLLAGMIIVFFLALYPSAARMALHLGLEPEEKALLGVME